MNTTQPILRKNQAPLNNSQKTPAYNNQSINIPSNKTISKFWGVWLPVPTILAIINSIFWTWLILSTVGYSQGAIEKSSEWIIEQF